MVQQNQVPRLRPNQGGVRGRYQQVMMVGRQQDADQFVEQYQQEEASMENNLTTMIERIVARNGMNTPLQRPTYSSPLAEYIVQTKNPRGWKIPKYTKFGGEIGESTIEHIAIYLTELGYMENNESLRVPEHELVQMVAGGLDYSIWKKIDLTFVKSMSQLADRVRHLERLRLEKVRHTKSKAKKEKVAYVNYDDMNPIYEADYISTTEVEIDLAEMKPGPAYDVNRCFRRKERMSLSITIRNSLRKLILLILVNARKFLMDLVQKSLQEGRLKFTARSMKIDADPLKQEEALFAEAVNINMVELSEIPDDMLEESIGETPQVRLFDVYPRMDEDLLDFLFRCKNQDSQVGLCPRCSTLTNIVAAENFQKLQLERGRAQWKRRDPRKCLKADQ
ncbi:uncharacterized protein LOC131598439 [Vicia villosa]|uniref:uncharacterized protein LOC131598439 n=1 Tax=Vicia villosa TaxID=3911 RepID=UPI00273C5DA7|nr:uncharacterized protein LOC131598439 [Vicia villosa]